MTRSKQELIRELKYEKEMLKQATGTTAIACEMEKFSWIGIELMPEYAEIAKARIGAVKDFEATLDTKTFIKESIKEDKEKELGIMNIFDFMEVEEWKDFWKEFGLL